MLYFFQFYCPVKKCQMPFESKELMEEHNKDSHQRHVCNFEGCGKEFKWKSILREHRKSHFPAGASWMADPDPDMSVDRFFVCTFCGKRFELGHIFGSAIQPHNLGRRPLKNFKDPFEAVM